MVGYSELGNFRPSRLHAPTIRREIIAYLKKHGGYLIESDQVNVRPPRQFTKEDGYVTYWHQDDMGNNSDNDRGELVLWSNRNSTRVRSINSKRIAPKAKDGRVLVIANHRCEHRMPKDGHRRWLVTVIIPWKGSNDG